TWQGPPVGHSFGSFLIAEHGPPAASRSATRRAAGERSSARNKGAKRPRAEVLGGAGGAGACAQGAAAMMERQERAEKHIRSRRPAGRRPCARARSVAGGPRSEEHTSELQSRENLVCRPLLDKTNNR